MGAANSKIEEDKALKLCRERKHYIRQALDGRCLLADAHVSYIQSLRNSGTALKNFVESEARAESSLYTSTSATPETLLLTNKSTSQLSNSNLNHSQGVDREDSFTQLPSPLSSARIHVSHMKASRILSTKVEEKPPVPVTVTMQTSVTTKKHLILQSEENSSFTNPSTPPGTPPWDYFGLFHPIDDHLSFQEERELNNGLDNVDEARSLREDEGIPELENGFNRTSMNGRDDSTSEDDFEQSSKEPLVQIFQNRNLEHQLESESPTNVESFSSKTNYQNGEKIMLRKDPSEIDETLDKEPSKVVTSPIGLPNNGNPLDNGQGIKQEAKDIFACIKDIEKLFVRASESGTEVPRMLEANKVQFRPLVPEEIGNKSKPSYLMAFCAGCLDEAPPPPPPQVSATNEIKYLTWHRSTSSNSSSSRNLLGVTSKDDVGDLSGSVFSSTCMNSGSHASTLDRLFAWERKLYDEVKASGIIRKEYDIKCRLLRHQDQRGESSIKIDKTRASVKDLHSRIRVAIHRIDSISKKIEEIRDKELQPQLEELIEGLTRMWEVMLDCHRDQCIIISQACKKGSVKVSISSEYHRHLNILQLELNSLSSSFTKWISAHICYLQSIREWLLKCVFQIKPQKSSRKRQRQQFSPRRDIAPPIFVTCIDWLRLLDGLPTKEVEDAIKDLSTLLSTQFSPRSEKGRANPNVSFSFARKGVQAEHEQVTRNETSVDWSLNYDNFQSYLQVLLGRLKTFAESSVTMYETLKRSVHEARDKYDRR